MASFTTHYQPTPLEQAYALYLLETVLQVPREPFRLSGRIAVPFLSSSGVDRHLLREIWTLVDPNMEGSLVELIQFTSALKLVSLAQRRWLDLAQYEGLLQFRQVPLASFANLMVPNNQLLLDRYPSATTQMPLLITPSHQLSVSDAFGDLDVVDTPMPSFLPIVPIADDDFGDMQGGDEQQAIIPTTTNDGVDGEFGDLEGDYSGAQNVHPTALNITNDGDFGGFEGVAASSVVDGIMQPIENQPISSIDAANDDDNADDFGDFEGTSTDGTMGAPAEDTFGDFGGTGVDGTGTIERPAEKTFGDLEGTGMDGTMEAPAEDSFGDFEGTSVHGTIEAPAEDTFGDFEGTSVHGTTEAPAEDSFGEFEETPVDVSNVDVSQPAPVSSAFNGMPSLPNAPLPDLGVSSAPLAGSVKHLGGIEETTGNTLYSPFDELQPVQNQPLPSLGVMSSTAQPEEDSGDFGDFEGTSSETRAMPGPPSSDFFEVQPAQNQSLPSPPEAEEDHDFGDFEGVVDEIPADPLSSTFDAPQSVENPPMPYFGILLPPVQPEANANFVDFKITTDEVTADAFSSAFDALQPVENQPLPSLDATSPPAGAEDDDCGDLEGTITDSADEAPTPSYQLSSAFDALQPDANQPQPSGAAISSPVALEETDDFGDFEGTTDSTHEIPAADPFSSAFDGLQPIENQPLSSLVHVMSSPVVPEAGNFGDFEGTADSTKEAPTPSDPFSSAFGPLQPVENQPLPYLGAVLPLPQEAEDSFGDFEGITDSVKETPADPLSAVFQPVQNRPLPSFDVDVGNLQGSDHITDATESTSVPLSAAFDGLPSTQDQPPPSVETTAGEALVDRFNAFEGALEAAQETSAVPSRDHFSSAFDKLQLVQDQPLPSLDSLPSPVQSLDKEEDDFGDFEGIEMGAGTGDVEPSQEESLVSAASVTTDVDNKFGGFEEATPTSGQSAFGEREVSLEIGSIAINQPIQQQVQNDDDPFSVFDALGGDPPIRTLAPLSSYSFGSQDQLPAEVPLVKESSFGDFKTPTGDLSPALGMMSAPPPAPTTGDITSGSDADDFGDFETPAESVATTPIESHAPRDLLNLASAFPGTAALQPQQQHEEEDTDFGGFEGVQATAAVASTDDDFGDFEGVKETVAEVSADDSFGDFEGVEAPTTNNDASSSEVPAPSSEGDLMNDFASFVVASETQTTAMPASDFDAFAAPVPAQEADVMGDFAGFVAAPEPRALSMPPAVFDTFAAPAPAVTEQADDDDDWGDFEHVQAPPAAPNSALQDDDFADFASASAPTKNKFANAFVEVAPAAAFDTKIGITPATTTQAALVAPTAQDDEFGDWDGFQDAATGTNTYTTPGPELPTATKSQGLPKTLEEIRDRLGSMQLPGYLSNINVSSTLGRNIITPIRIGSLPSTSSRSFGSSSSNSTMIAMQRAQRCYQLVTFLQEQQQLVLLLWNRILTVARDELTMGSLLLQQAKKVLSSISAKTVNTTRHQQQQQTEEIRKALSTMVASLGECVRVVRSIVTTVADILCLDLGDKKMDLTANKEWQSLEVIQLSVQVEDLWKAIITSSKRELRLAYRPTSLETCAAIQKQAWQATTTASVELCHLTLQPLVQQNATRSSEKSTKSKVEFQKKSFMACAANLWLNRILTDEVL